MDSLYSRLADQWELLFPSDSERVLFLTEMIETLTSGARIIEVGCGTGATAISLASLGHAVAASDLDNDMTTTALRSAGDRVSFGSDNYYPESGHVRFTVDDMIGALEKAPPGTAHAVLCLGNTLPHLTGAGELKSFFRAAGAALVSGGKLVIQILNYPRIVCMGSLELPDLEGEELLFRRRQTFKADSGLVVFDTEVESGGRTERRSHNLLPVDVKNLMDPALESGLTPSGIYRDWEGTEFDSNAPWLVSTYTSSRKSS